MEPPTRVELVTSSLPWMRSTTELGWHLQYKVARAVNLMVQGVGFEPTKA